MKILNVKMKVSCIFISILFLINAYAEIPQQKKNNNYDVIVVGATFSGIASAINAAKFGHSVVLIEEYPHIGGLMTGGLSYTDFLSYEVLGGTFRDYMQRVEQYYINKYGANSKQVADSHKGVHAEPHVTLQIFHQMLEQYPNIQLFVNHRLEKVLLGRPESKHKIISGIMVKNREDQSYQELTGRIFIDATYEGDLAAYAGAEYRVGRESRQEYGEVFAGKIYYDSGRILPGSTGEADSRVQGYNFRIIMTNNPDNRRLIEKPANYNREKFLPMAEVLQKGDVSNVFSESRDGIFRIQMLPNQKSDMNDIKNSPVRMALLGENYEYPEGGPEVRDRIVQAHKEHNLGMLYFVQNDPSMPEDLKQEAREWGLAKDEFVDNNNFPYRLYIREARRIQGHYVFTEHDVRLASNSIRTNIREDAIAIGDYSLNCHGEQPPGRLHPTITEGDFGFGRYPFQIQYGVIVPRKFGNLLVSVAISASHVGFSGIRLEPTWTALGQAAGLAAHLAIETNVAVPDVNVHELQLLLHNQEAKTIYISDIESDSPYFKSAQYFGTRGYFHDLVDTDSVSYKFPERTFGLQYFEAFPYHELRPDEKLDIDLAMQWINLLKGEEVKEQARSLFIDDSYSRGEFLNTLFELSILDNISVVSTKN